MAEYEKVISLRMDDALLAKLEALGASFNLTRSAVIIYLLRAALEDRGIGVPEPATPLNPFAFAEDPQ